MTVKGIDVSSNNSNNYSTQGLDFVIVKATEGRTFTNPKQHDQAKRAREAGLVLGFYHFLWPGVDEIGSFRRAWHRGTQDSGW